MCYLNLFSSIIKMGLFGNLFSETENTRNVEKLLENNTTLKNEITNLNKNISSQIANIMMKSMQEMAVGQDITQDIKIKGVVAVDDVNISNIRQKAKVKVNLSAMQNTELQSEMLEKIQNQLSQGIKEAIKNVQNKDNIQGEQWVKEFAGVLNNVVDAVAGGDTTENIKETVRNSLNSENIQKNIQEVETNVASNISNETMAKIASNFSADQGITISDIAAGGNATISNIDQEALSEQILTSIQETGASTKLISDVMGFSETFTEKMVSSEQSAQDVQKSTLSGVGDVFSGIFSGISGIFSGSGGIIVGIVSIVCSSIVGIGLFLYMQNMQKQKGGYSMSPKSIQNFFQKNQTIGVILVALGVFFIAKKIETFKKTKKILLKHDDKYIYPKDNELYLTSDKNLAGNFDLHITSVVDEPDTVLIQLDNQYARKVDNKIYLQNYELFDKEKHNFHIKELSDDSFELYRGDENIVVINNKLGLSSTERNKFKIVLE